MSERLERWCRGLASLALLVGLVVGVPAALLVLGGDPVPHADLRTIGKILLQPDDGTVLARLLALVGWLAWAVFVVTLLVELVNLVGRQRRGLVLPGLGSLQQWAAGLMLSVVALGAAAQLTSGGAATAPAVTAAAEPARTTADPVSSTARPSPSAIADEPGRAETGREAEVVAPVDAPHGRRERVHVVTAGDDLWSLAERYYGRGQDWRRIAAANPDFLTGGPDRLRVGWRLVVPETGSDASGRADDGRPRVRVRPGDSLSAIAERELGDGDRWNELYRANRDQLADPDELPVGLVLRLPDGPTGRSDDPAATPQERAEDADPPDEVPVGRDDADRQARPAGGSSSGSATPSTTPAATSPAEPTARPVPAGPTVGGDAEGRGDPAPADRPSQEGLEPADEQGAAVPLPGLAGVGGLLAAALVGGLAARRRWQLQRRPVGRRIAHPPPTTRPVEVALARRARPIGLRTLDRASRAVAAASADAGLGVPALRSASVSSEWLVLELSGPTPPAPRCFVDTGTSWCLASDAVDDLRSVTGVADAVRPWPLLVTLGTEEGAEADGAERVVDLESIGLLALTGEQPATTGVMAAMALELACSPWTEELRLTLVGDDRLAPALAQHNVQTTDDLDGLLDRLERVARARREHGGGSEARDLRLDPDRAEAWTPEVVLVGAPPTPKQVERLVRLTRAVPGEGVTAVVGGPVEGAGAVLALSQDGAATLRPDGVRLLPQTLAAAALDQVVELVGVTGSEVTHPAPWWSTDDPPEAPPDNVTYLGRRRRTDETDEQERRAAVQARMTEAADGTARHPLLRLIGPVDLVGATGTPPTRAAKQCLEYCAWLLEHPGATAQAMATGLLVAEGTRRSNMSRLRSWLGDGADGEPYLPDAYSGHIWLDPVVSSDWHQLQLLVAEGVDQVPTSVLELGLRLVRGAPFADAAPVQWHWAEELRSDIVSCLRDIGVELARRALEDGDVDLARWAASRALVVSPGDELLLASRIRTEHQAGNVAETERLCLHLAQQARVLGADLDPATVDLIQEVMEGRLRARFA
ncbi:LysM peptidoglycan-binding domain-containing protein [Microlunatus flavus]|uniref:LysM domain-containing protein n=1 Tax=Microlunatus flavus TaxID=1036181 RepID=A0A1H9B2Y7_9ACTN|nr:LysM peptidoglycan-binding domain-containing protein [Microlunatus flavus]SEP83219.1 LysM domain-containing protein [Microlunatus flavus]